MKTVTAPIRSELYNITCSSPGCKAVLETETRELKYVNGTYVLTCPHCTTETIVGISGLSKLVKKKA